VVLVRVSDAGICFRGSSTYFDVDIWASAVGGQLSEVPGGDDRVQGIPDSSIVVTRQCLFHGKEKRLAFTHRERETKGGRSIGGEGFVTAGTGTGLTWTSIAAHKRADATVAREKCMAKQI